MKVYFVAVVNDQGLTDVTPFTSAVRQKAYFRMLPRDSGAWVYGPIDFPLGGKGIMSALEYGIKSRNVTIDSCDDDYDCGGEEE